MSRPAQVITLHQRSSGRRHTYTIEVYPTGSYFIRLGPKLLRTWHDPLVMRRMIPPSPELEAEALQTAIAAIEELRGMREE